MPTRRSVALLLLLGVLAGCRTGRNYPGADGPRYVGGPASAAAPAGRDTLRVVSFNIEYALHADSAITFLRTDPALRDADVILLQEMDADATRRMADALGMWYAYYPAIHRLRSRRDFGNAVLSRWPIVEDAKLVLPHVSRYARTQRIATAATIRVGETPVRVYSTHLGTPLDVGGGARRDQLRAILDDAARHPRVILGGDMNSAAVGRLAAERGFAWPTERGPRTTRLGRWDHIFVRGLAVPDGAASGTATHVRGISDHVPVWTRVVLR
jgi:endonuclease/exonuclease/phosphatase family metal-dependent hydrolase